MSRENNAIKEDSFQRQFKGELCSFDQRYIQIQKDFQFQ